MSAAPRSPQFGISVHPALDRRREALERARLADKVGLDLVTIMDHPYHRAHLDTWTLLTTIGAITENVRLAPNVANVPLRPPAMLAKMAATLDLLTEGRVELGIGAGGSWDGIHAFGGPRREPKEAYQAFKEALHIIRGLWDHAGESFDYEGDYYQVRGARFGPAPAHRIPIWAGAYGPSMQRLTGRAADGVIVSYSYARPEKLNTFNERLDEGAEQAGRSPSEIRRGYNIYGTIQPPGKRSEGDSEDKIVGPPEEWIDRLSQWHLELRQDTFILWPAGPDPDYQIRAYAEEVVPGVVESIG